MSAAPRSSGNSSGQHLACIDGEHRSQPEYRPWGRLQDERQPLHEFSISRALTEKNHQTVKEL